MQAVGPTFSWVLISTPGSLSFAPRPAPGRAGPASSQRASPLAERSLSLTEDQVSAFGAGHHPQPKAMGESRSLFTCTANHRSPTCPPPHRWCCWSSDHPSPMDLREDIKTWFTFSFFFLIFLLMK